MNEKINNYNGRDYRTVWQQPRAMFEDRFEGGIIRRLVTEKPGWFIDLGGGYGRLYPVCKKSGRKIVIVDYALNLLELAAKEFKDDENVFFVAANAYHLPFQSGVFSGGISVRVFHHMNLPEQFMDEFGRVTRSGGEILLEYANKRNLFRIIRRGGKSLKRDHEEYEPLHYGTHPAFFRRIATAAGFAVTRTLGTGFFPRFITRSSPALDPILAAVERVFDSTFGRVGLAPLNFASLKKVGPEVDNGASVAADIGDILQCPACGARFDHGNFAESEVRCFACKRTFPKNGRILDLRYTP